MTPTPQQDPGVKPGNLRSRSFIGLVLTQFLGAFNDNMLRWLVVPIAQQIPTLETGTVLALGGVCFTFPYLLLAPAAGSLADRYSKRNVIVACKAAEVIIMLCGIAAILIGNVWGLFAVVALMGAQSALFAPSKFGSLPEMLDLHHLSKGNGVMGLVTVLSSALGTVAGYGLYSLTQPDLQAGVTLATFWPAATALLGVAAVGFATSLLIARRPAADPAKPITVNPITDTLPALRLLTANRGLFRAALGIAFFWAMASLAQLNIDRYGAELLDLPEVGIGVLLCMLVAGVGAGSLLAGYWSGGRVELGLVPLGAVGIAVSSLLVFAAGSWIAASPHETAGQAFFWSSVCLILLGISAGLFNVPLEAYLQHSSDVRTRGTILAGSNFVSFAFILISCGLFTLLHDYFNLTPAQIFMAAGLGTIPVVIDAFRLLPDITVRFLFWLASHTIYRVRVIGDENIPERGGALLVANHVSWMDGVLLTSLSTRMIRFLVWGDYADKPGLRWLGKTMRVIPIISTDGPKAIVRSLQTAREALAQGHLVGIFAEGQITRTGDMQEFQPGLMKIVAGTGCPVIPVYLHGLWGSIFSYEGGRAFWKLPRQWPFPVTVVFGEPIHAPDSVSQVRQVVEQLGVQAVEHEKPRQLIPVRQFIRYSKQHKSKGKLADSSGLETSGAKTLIGALAFRRVLERNVFAKDEQTVGLLLPPSVGGALANLAVALSGRTSANLNYTLSDDVINDCIRAGSIKHVLTSRRFLEKKPCQIEGAEVVYLEDLKEQVTGLDKAVAALCAYAVPAPLLERSLGLHRIDPDDPCTIIFTSGSTGEPKGVMLTHHNIGSNIAAVNELLNPTLDEVILGVLPFFHSFGYTATLWLPACYRPKAVYHFNPLDAKTVGKLAEKHKVTILLAPPTFLKTYMKRCTPEQFAALDTVIVGAEKMPLSLAQCFEEKFGVQLTEGYGTTELSPVAAVNVPPHRLLDKSRKGTKLGTVGRPLPGCAAKVVDPDTFKDRGLNTEGLLLIKGPNVMKGYLNQPAKTAAVIHDGWYNTGDFAKIDDEGFIEITGRQSRFSKIAGEMVPHIRVEEELARIIDGACSEGSGEEAPALQVAVTAIPDDQKGERLIVIHRRLPKPVDQVLK
ncbi:MAG: acyl-[ACP]--phospholipid O-acyltransferase, partial [Planctomycetaceae bacterium]